ncbi:DUF4419 domain-containing protein [Actinoplanes regularis]|uniref:DUF4419 domain-containing protein n=1 Tax=Actinoplanes regularis TaxID=52697 RepID=UPI0024A0124C|nr:DUF4419 domain-containing protein [Actinoplanes regularis]GLW34387.1 hypothetical protein Areg01_73240 [Actinoplanes regularis]
MRAAEGDADQAFWQRILKLRQGSGGDRATGWVTRFYPYLGERDQPNPLLDRPIDDMTEPGIVSDDATATLSRVKVVYDGAWRLRPFDSCYDLGGHWWIAPVFDLSDGRSLCVVGEFASDRNYWTIAHWADRKLVDDPAGLRVFGQSLAELLEVALDTGGDVTHLDSGALSDYLEM